jgi:hypothetical protein
MSLDDVFLQLTGDNAGERSTAPKEDLAAKGAGK